jgi:hypothetical protein
MFDVSNNQYKNLASKGRYGDTMLAHINPQEASLLKSMGGAGSINPNTGLPEFYGVSLNVGIAPVEKPPAPSISQAVDPSKLTLPLQLPTKVIPQTSTGTGKGIQLVPEKTVVDDAYDKYKTIDYSFTPSKSGAKPQELGYEIPVEGVKFQGVDLVGVYDNTGKFLHYTAPVTQSIDLGNGYLARPFINASGGLTEFRQYKPDSGGIIESGIRDLGPLALAALGANLYSGVNLLGGTAGAATAGTAASAASAGTTTGAAAGTITNGLMGSVLPSGAGGTLGVTAASTGSVIASQIAQQGVTPSLVQKAAEFLGVQPETLNALAPSAIQGLLSAGGAYLQGEQAKESAQTQADAQIRAAQIAADAARFRPVGVTTRFGSSNFQTDAAGNVIGAGYTASPEILGYQNRLSALANQGLTDAEVAQAAYAPLTGAAQNLFSLGQSYLKKTPEEVAADYIAKQQALLAPTQENQLALLQNKLFQQGRTGAATAQGGNLMATSPELAAYYNSLAQSNLVLAAQADQEARNRITYGAGLFDTGANLQGRYYTGQTAALAPFTNAMDVTTGLENLAQIPMTLGTQIGAKTTASAAEAGRLTSTGIINAANTMAPSNAYSLGGNLLSGVASSPNVTSALNKAFGVTQQPTQQQFTYDTRTGQYVPVPSAFAT